MATKGYKLDELWDDEILQMLAVIRPTSESFKPFPFFSFTLPRPI